MTEALSARSRQRKSQNTPPTLVGQPLKGSALQNRQCKAQFPSGKKRRKSSYWVLSVKH
ncbi:MAG: hypothetical protein N3D11_08155 [Candidatus Sumerlaeia bacterium]|nr:hypothetical protein [Candidatus Sumerlaeia bacterium]